MYLPFCFKGLIKCILCLTHCLFIADVRHLFQETSSLVLRKFYECVLEFMCESFFSLLQWLISYNNSASY
jgi:hypothetical protein